MDWRSPITSGCLSVYLTNHSSSLACASRRRTDVAVKEIPDYLIPKADAKYLDSYGYEFYAKKRPEVIKRVIELLGR